MSSVKIIGITLNIKSSLLQYIHHLMFNNVVVKEVYTLKRL